LKSWAVLQNMQDPDVVNNLSRQTRSYVSLNTENAG